MIFILYHKKVFPAKEENEEFTTKSTKEDKIHERENNIFLPRTTQTEEYFFIKIVKNWDLVFWKPYIKKL